AGWGLDRSRIEVLVNPAPPPPDLPAVDLPDGTLVFVGRLTSQKALPVALRALVAAEEARLVIVGDGPARGNLDRLTEQLGLNGRVRFEGARKREEVLRMLAGARAALLSSEWENLPHAAVEALSVGTPVVSTAVGGVPEVVRNDENGLLVPAGDVEAMADAIRRIVGDDALRARLGAAAQPSVAAIGREHVYERLEAILLEAVR